MYKQILVPIDLADTDLAKPAIEAAVTLARSSGGSVRLINVLPMTPVMLAEYVPPDFDVQQRKSANEAMAIIASESGLDPAHISGTVRLNRGAGAGCTMPSTLTKELRARLCGWSGASKIDNTGAKHTSVPSMIWTHSAWVLPLNTRVNSSLSAGHCFGSIWGLKRSRSRPAFSTSSA